MYIESFAERLKQARINAGLYQADVTAEIGLNRSTLSNYEIGRTQPDIETLGRLIDLYEVSADWILGTGIKNRAQP